MPALKDHIDALVANAQLEEALEYAKQQALSGWTALDTPATLLLAEFRFLEQTALRGELSFADLSAKRQNLASRLLDIVEEVEQQTPATQTLTAPASQDVLLFLGANPFCNLALELDREVQEISAGLTRFGKRDAFDFRAKIHVTATELQRMLLEVASLKPRFVHFAGNAVVNHTQYGTGVIFENEKGQPRTIGGDVLGRMFKLFPSVECVFLNTCDSGPAALEVGQTVPFVIGMNDRVYDESAIVFAVAFYEAIAGGQSIPDAFDFAKTRLLLESYPDQADIPVLVSKGQCPDPVYRPGQSHLDDVRHRVSR